MLPYQKPKLVVCCLLAGLLTLVSSQHPAQQGCPEATRPHTIRCDQYFRCALLPSKRAVWITSQCKKGLVYRHNASGCVVPDNDWECDLSTEYERNHGEEQLYGIDNPHQQASFPPSRTPPAVGSKFPPKMVDAKRQTQYQLPSIAGDDRRGILIRVDQELNNRTRVRSTEALAGQTEMPDPIDAGYDRVTVAPKTHVPTDNGTIVKPYLPQSLQHGAERDTLANNEQRPPKPLAHTGAVQTVNPPGRVEFTKPGGGERHKAKLPLPPNGKIHPEHLTQIINQQKQLNRIATQLKQRVDPIGGPGGLSALSSNMIFSRHPILLNDYLHGLVAAQKQQPEGDKTFHGKEPYVSEDIIKSILQISQQMIANQQKTTPSTVQPIVGVKPSKAPSSVKPIYLPLSVGSGATDAGSGAAPSEYGVPGKAQITTTFSTKPIGISFTNPYTLSHTAVYDNLRSQPLNESTYYNSYLPTLYDIYGNRFVPKDQYVQMMSQSYPQYSTQYMGAGSSRPLLNLQPIPTYPSVVSPYVSPPQGPVISEPSFMYSHHTSPPSLVPLPSNVADGYTVTSNAIDRFEPLAFADSNESDGNDSADSEQTFVSAEASNELDPMDGNEALNDPNLAFKQKLFALGETALDYSQYKDSIMPLLDAHPNDVRISVVTCTLGSREPNKTDCFKYFVCNPHNGAFQSFTCPSFTAFNKETRLCDTASYHACMGQQMPTTTPASAIRPTSNIHLMKNDLLTAQKYVELMRQEANKLLTRNNMPLPAEQTIVLPALDTVNATVFHTVKPSVKMRRKSSSKPTAKMTTSATTTTTTTTTTIAPKTKRSKTTRKGPRCRAEGRVANPLDQHSYYVCHRKSQKKFVKMKMTCPSGLKYCATSQYCSAHC